MDTHKRKHGGEREASRSPDSVLDENYSQRGIRSVWTQRECDCLIAGEIKYRNSLRIWDCIKSDTEFGPVLQHKTSVKTLLSACVNVLNYTLVHFQRLFD